jgi:hypothetical protein
MDYAYAITPFAAWLTAGSLKFIVNSVRAGKPAFGLIGYGGLPSNHSAIVSSMAALIAFREGVSSAAFGVALTLAFIVILDASSLRKQVGRQARAINALTETSSGAPRLRERIGHTPVEIAVGVVVGIAVARIIQTLLG